MSREVHSRLFAVEYDISNAATNDRIGALATQLSEKVISVTQSRIMCSLQGYPRIHITQPKTEDEAFDIPVIFCDVPCSEDDLPETSFAWLHNDIVAQKRIRRARPAEFAKALTAGMRKVLRGSELYQAQNGNEMFLSGPHPIAMQDLRNRVKAFPVLQRALPLSAEEYARDVAATCNDMFALVTGGTIPRISCDLEYMAL